jgi:hypothetical protein
VLTWRGLLLSGRPLPDDTQLPFEDGKRAKSSAEAPLRELLTSSLGGWLERNGHGPRYYVNGGTGIFWRLPEPPEPLSRGVVVPDWFYVRAEPPRANGRPKRSYVLWHERVVPLIALEFVLPGDTEARDRTPWAGKFWVYEQGLGVRYYGIFELESGRLEFYHRVSRRYEVLHPNASGRWEITPLELELGVWRGRYRNCESAWLRWWDPQGNLLLTGWEQTEQYRLEAEQTRRQLEEERRRVELLTRRLRALGIDPGVP